MGIKALVLGESGSGKSTSIRNCDPATTAIVNPVGKPLPFKGKFPMLNSVTDARAIIKWVNEQVGAGKKLIVVDDFQYILAVPYMNRIKETGWDKYNDFGANYFDIIRLADTLPEDVVVVYMSHCETLESGLTTIKLIGKLLREKITIEGLFTTVLRTNVSEGNYYFITQNSGKDTVKAPIGMFPSYAIDNDLNYVADKMRNYYEVGAYKSDEDMAKADEEVKTEIERPTGRRRSVTTQPIEQAVTRRSRREEAMEVAEEVQREVDAVVAETIPNAETEGVPFEQYNEIAEEATKKVRKTRAIKPTANTESEENN